ncbi:MAG TPA: hypothetical protein VE623_03810 [Acidimicrobiales bacterium]|nr:hypothetical protein [Acidimicrobiales bacterium]
MEPVGTIEIAERLGVTRDAVNQWRRRGLGFPEPQWNVGGRPAWEWEDVEAWARETGAAVVGHVLVTSEPLKVRKGRL